MSDSCSSSAMSDFNIISSDDLIEALEERRQQKNEDYFEEVRYNEQEFFEHLRVQIVCDHCRKIRDVFLGFPRLVHESRVFRVTSLAASLQDKCGDFYILGDRGYPGLVNLLTPFKDRGQLIRKPRNYNLKLAKNRYVAEYCIDILTQKLPPLFHVKLRQTGDIVDLIRGCCMLRNLAIEDYFPEIEEPIDHEEIV